MCALHAVRLRSRERDRTPVSAPTPVRKPRRLPRKQQLLLILVDALLAETFFLASLLLLRELRTPHFPEVTVSGPPFLLLAVLFPLVVGSRGLYRLGRFRSWRGQARAGVRALAWSVGISVAALFLFAQEIPWGVRVLLTLYHAMLGVWMVALRPLVVVALEKRPSRAGGSGLERVLIFGSEDLAEETIRRLSTGGADHEVIAVSDLERPVRGFGACPFRVATLESLPDLAAELGADLVLLTQPDMPREQVVLLGDRLSSRGVSLRVAFNVFNALVDTRAFESAGGLPFIPIAQTPLSGTGLRLKRYFDFGAALAGGVAVLPLILLFALLVRLSSPGPVLYKQIRIGRGGRPFVFYKFRSMRAGNDDTEHRKYIEKLMAGGGAAATDGDGNKVYKLVNDARVTRIGRLLRRTSLDELPQLINVLRGEMSLVGPRPCLPFEYELYRDWQKRRLDVTPGMTGLWQVTGRSYVTFDDMVLLDLFYIGNWSVWMDLNLLLRTVPVMVWGKGGV